MRRQYFNASMLFDSSLRKELARTFGATLVVWLTIFLTMMLIRVLGQAAGGSVAPQDVALLLGYTVLGYLPTILSLSLFVAVVATLTRMYRDSEMVIWFVSGASLMRMVPTVMSLSWPVLFTVAVLVLAAWPWSNRQSTELRDRYERRSDLSRVAPGHFQSSSDGRRVFFIDKDTTEGKEGRNVFILANDGTRESVTTAVSGQIELQDDGDRYLVLDQGARTDLDTATGDKMLARFQQYRVLAGEKSLTGMDELPPKARSTLEMLGDPDPRAHGELAWRLGMALAASNLVLLGMGLAAGDPRRGSSWNLLFALLAFIVYLNLVNLTQAWVASGKASLGGALLGVHGTVLLCALFLLWWRDRGAATLGRRARMARPAAKPDTQPDDPQPAKAAKASA
jgi:lipopolysaccharide export system permease protein